MYDENITVLIADDHGVVREGLRAVLEEDGLIVIGEATNGREAVTLALDLKPDVILLDIRMPDMNGLQALAEIKTKSPQTQVVMLTTYATADYLTKAIRAGATGYLSKDADPQKIPTVVRTAAANVSLFDRELMRSAINPQTRSTIGTLHPPITSTLPLSDRELEVLRLIVAGHNNEGIANALVISLSTVKTHIRHILEKLGVPDRTQAAIWAVRSGIA